jgi:hypothetical protein
MYAGMMYYCTHTIYDYYDSSSLIRCPFNTCMYIGIVFILGYMLTQCKVQCTEQTLRKEFSYRLVKICCSHNFIFLCDVKHV